MEHVRAFQMALPCRHYAAGPQVVLALGHPLRTPSSHPWVIIIVNLKGRMK